MIHCGMMRLARLGCVMHDGLKAAMHQPIVADKNERVPCASPGFGFYL